MKATITIDKRKELNEYFDKYGNGGFSARMQYAGGKAFTSIRFTENQDLELLVPFMDLVFYAGFLPPRGGVK